ncbi:hypothetical protein D9757_013310 [Collybiopsis confluens]|uniref:Uncharacterized protein n=1 Tax=Collybiopsis confluens TaxID=2823264 RepID=A0A8H5CQF8_9AGAR|nr:hypothetical protein D9757_013310 [Collybiopsis confluens]
MIFHRWFKSTIMHLLNSSTSRTARFSKCGKIYGSIEENNTLGNANDVRLDPAPVNSLNFGGTATSQCGCTQIRPLLASQESSGAQPPRSDGPLHSVEDRVGLVEDGDVQMVPSAVKMDAMLDSNETEDVD